MTEYDDEFLRELDERINNPITEVYALRHKKSGMYAASFVNIEADDHEIRFVERNYNRNTVWSSEKLGVAVDVMNQNIEGLPSFSHPTHNENPSDLEIIVQKVD